jgi:tetratricopeptide (TPR) repeat protein
MSGHAERRAWIAAFLIATSAIYWPALKSPLQFDDLGAFSVVHQMVDGQLSVAETLDAHRTGPLGRPIATLTMIWGALIHGDDPLAIHLLNLLLHLACGYSVWQFVSLCARQLSFRDTHLDREWVALIICAAWLLSPMFITTVAYAVQRMAQLSTLFTLIGLVAYLRGRNALNAGRWCAAAAQWLLVYPSALLVGLFSKENTAVLLPLTLMCEALLYGFSAPGPRPRRLVQIFSAGLTLGIAVGVVYVFVRHESLQSGYAIRDFTLFERLLSQPRVLMEYLAKLIAPVGDWGLIHDDIVVSRGLYSPPTTMLALLAWVAILVAAARSAPLRGSPILFGLLFYLIGHAVESSILPLELYFEHRNYLPAIGLFIAVVGVVDAVAHYFRLKPDWSLAPLWPMLLGVILLVRSLAWADQSSLLMRTHNEHPKSRRASVAIAYGTAAQGYYDQALDLIRAARARERLDQAALLIDEMLLLCQAQRPLPQSLVDETSALQSPVVSSVFSGNFSSAVAAIGEGHCPGAWTELLTDLGERALHGGRVVRGLHEVLLLKDLGDLRRHAGDIEGAIPHYLQALERAGHSLRQRQTALIKLADSQALLNRWDDTRRMLDCYITERPAGGLYLLDAYVALDHIVRHNGGPETTGACVLPTE